MKEKKEKKRMSEWKPIERVIVLSAIGLIMGTILWLLVLILLLPFANIFASMFRNDKSTYIDLMGSVVGLIILAAMLAGIIVLAFKIGWWDKIEIDKINSNPEDKYNLRTNEKWLAAGENVVLGEPHHTAGMVIGTKNKQKTAGEILNTIIEPTFHVALLAPTGTGKSQVFIIPSIISNLSVTDKYSVKEGKLRKAGLNKLEIANIKKGIIPNDLVIKMREKNIELDVKKYNAPNIVVVDVKGELYNETASYAADHGYKVHCFDTNKGGESLGYNPLYQIHQYWKKGREGGKNAEAAEQQSKEMLENAVINVLEMRANEKGDAFWKNGEARMLTGLIAVMFDMYEGGGLDEDQVSLATAHEITTNIQAMIGYCRKYGKSKYYKLYLEQTIESLSKDEHNKTINGILTGVQNKIRIFDIYKSITSRDDFHLINQKEKNIIYLKVPDEEFASYKIVSLFIEQDYVTRVFEAKSHPSGKLIRSRKIIWDELGNFPVVNSLPSMVRMSRSRGYQFMFALQDQDTLEANYGKNEAATILKQCQAQLGLRVQLADAKYFSDLVGLRKAKNNRNYNSNGSFGTSISENYKEIIRPDEIQNFEIIETTSDRGNYSESIYISPRSKFVNKNPAWFLVSDHLTGAYDNYTFDVVDTYYGDRTDTWKEAYKQIHKEIDQKMKEWNSKEWREKFVANWKKRNGRKFNKEALEEEIKIAREAYLREHGMLFNISMVKELVKHNVKNKAIFTINEDIIEQTIDQKLLDIYAPQLKELTEKYSNWLSGKYPEMKQEIRNKYGQKVNTTYGTSVAWLSNTFKFFEKELNKDFDESTINRHELNKYKGMLNEIKNKFPLSS